MLGSELAPRETDDKAVHCIAAEMVGLRLRDFPPRPTTFRRDVPTNHRNWHAPTVTTKRRRQIQQLR